MWPHRTWFQPHDGFDTRELQATLVAPIKELLTARIGHAGVGGAGGKEFDDAATGQVGDDNLLCGPLVEARQKCLETIHSHGFNHIVIETRQVSGLPILLPSVASDCYEEDLCRFR
jgi:hypothetical protein